MNFLAHLYLASPDPELMFGGVLADFVRGRAVNDYADPIRKGIRLHIQIDAFTDNHPIVAAARKRFQAPFRRYAGILIDLAFDHFLASQWDAYSPRVPLDDFASKAYNLLQTNASNRPERMSRAVAAMQRENWLVSYRKLEGIENALCRLSLRLSRENPLNEAGGALRANYSGLQSDFARFHPDLVRFVTLARRTAPR